ncbi:MAG: hypothetical protein PHI96_01860 [Desulfovibrio sp.]|nr:hypothetical protein [Desulfovibrio sp.]
MPSSYVAHVMEGRARLRHPALAEAKVRDAAQALLQAETEVSEVRFGSESLLLLMAPGTDFAAICKRLEKKVPALLKPKSEVAAARRAEKHSQLAVAACKGAARGTGFGDMLGDMQVPAFLQALVSGTGNSKIMGITHRKFAVRTMLGAGGLCLLTGFAGGKSLHVVAGLTWAALATRHVWVRRKAL